MVYKDLCKDISNNKSIDLEINDAKFSKYNVNFKD
jgi:hypothetical protein